MALQSSGSISLGDIQTFYGGSASTSISEYYAGGSYVETGATGDGGAIPTSGQISIGGDFYGGKKKTWTAWTKSADVNNAGLGFGTISISLAEAQNLELDDTWANWGGGSTGTEKNAEDIEALDWTSFSMSGSDVITIEVKVTTYADDMSFFQEDPFIEFDDGSPTYITTTSPSGQGFRDDKTTRTHTWSDTPTNWGLTSGELDTLFSTASKGFTFGLTKDSNAFGWDSTWSVCQCRNLKMRIEYWG